MSLANRVLDLVRRMLKEQGALEVKPDETADYYAILDDKGNMLDNEKDLFIAMDRAKFFSMTGRTIHVYFQGMHTAKCVYGSVV